MAALGIGATPQASSAVGDHPYESNSGLTSAVLRAAATGSHSLARASRYRRSHEARFLGRVLDYRRRPAQGARPQAQERRAGGNRVKVRREVAGRRGKAVTTVSGLPVDDAGLKELAGKLKKRCGVGGSVKGGVIEMQGDHRDVVVEILKAEAYTPVLAVGG
jgi:translation initiation factor 1